MLEQYCALFPDVCKMPAGVTIDSSIDLIKLSLSKAQKQVASFNELRLARTGLITICGAVETASQFIPFIKLQGMTENVNASIETFDSVLKELSIKYMSDLAPCPEMVLLFLLGQIAMTTHMSNTKKYHDARAPNISSLLPSSSCTSTSTSTTMHHGKPIVKVDPENKHVSFQMETPIVKVNPGPTTSYTNTTSNISAPLSSSSTVPVADNSNTSESKRVSFQMAMENLND
jgi:hypothetical protein